MKEILVVVDIQKDFVDGSLGTKEALAMIPQAVKKIKDFDGDIFVTLDTHEANYLDTAEGKKLPVPHCIRNTEGWELNKSIAEALKDKNYTLVEKSTFGSVELPKLIGKAVGEDDFQITLIGLCTDICVVSNALLLKANYPEKEIFVDSKCCAGVSLASHQSALDTMKMCQINVV